jgi:hypothetical protein
MEHCARKYDLLRHIRFDTEIADARFDADAVSGASGPRRGTPSMPRCS